MKRITIKSLSLLNFKGIRKLEITQFGEQTNIFGANASGKTTIFDAFTWLLFGKDSTDRQAFEVKTLDQDNNVIPKIEHHVTAILSIDGEDVEIKRTLTEKWVKQRGALETTFQGNEQGFFWNGVPMQSGEFSKKVSTIMDEKVFKLITNPLAFNSMKWQDQRQVLMDIAGGITDQEVAKGNDAFVELLSKLSNKSLEEYKKQVAVQVKNAKDELKMLPTRIDEVERGKPEAQDFNLHRTNLMVLEDRLKDVDDQITDKLQAQQAINEQKVEKQNRIYALKSEVSKLEFNAKTEAERQIREAGSNATNLLNQINSVDAEIKAADNSLNTLKSSLQSKKNDQENLENKVKDFRSQWEKRNAETFQMPEGETACPTCKREFEAESLQEKKAEAELAFKTKKQRDLATISSQGKSHNQILENTKKEIITLTDRVEAAKANIESLKAKKDELEKQLEEDKSLEGLKSVEEITAEILSKDEEINSKKGEIAQLQEALENQKGVDVDDLKSQKTEITSKISELKSQLQTEEQIKRADDRISELMAMETSLAQQIADVEKEQFTIENFIKAKIDRLEAIINGKFSLVKFKMFETLINGGETETCKALVDGVPFSDANNAAKINAGIDIINTLCQHYQVSAPIFVDNRESVSQLVESNSQIINLIVSEADTKLRVEAGEMVATA